MTIVKGLSALNLLSDEGQESTSFENKFSHLKSGDSRIVRVLSLEDVVAVPTYSIFKKVNTFKPKDEPELTAKDYPRSNLTPFDKAWKYHNDLSEKFGDEHSQEAYKYRVKRRFAIGFYDLDEKKCIVIDFSKNQAMEIFDFLTKNEKKLDKKAFELSKTGSGTQTKVSLNILDVDDSDLTEAQIEAFNNAPTEFDDTLFDNLYFELDNDQMVSKLKEIGFDLSLIGIGETKRTQTVSDVAEEDFGF